MAAFGFTPASEHDVFSIAPALNKSKPSIELSGDEARQFYEDMIKDDKELDASGSSVKKGPIRQKSGGSSRRTRRRVRGAEVHQVQTGPAVQREVSGGTQVNSERSVELLGLRLLRCAHQGDISGLKELLSKGVDINFQDTFLWTAVMCASWSGQKTAVRLLLSHGAAWVGVVDTQGRDAHDLALEAGHNEVLEELLSYGRSPEIDRQTNSRKDQPPLYFCKRHCNKHPDPRAIQLVPMGVAALQEYVENPSGCSLAGTENIPVLPPQQRPVGPIIYSRVGSYAPQVPQSCSVLPPQWCGVCCTEYRSSPSSHLSSTLHQFSLRRPPPTPYYCLPPSSNSYKMMVRCGWKPGTGLGPDGEGPHQPVPTVLKRDQEGLGYGWLKRAKVTHFQARDQNAVKQPHREKEERRLKGQRREETKRKEQREKNWERDFRASFYL